MSGSFTPRTEILPVAQQRLWPELRPARDLEFVLYGGTAIALRLGHRQSVDFDFFTDRALNIGALTPAFSFIARSTVLQDQIDAFSLLVPSDETHAEYVRLSFFGPIGVGRVGEPDLTDDGILLVASLDDLIATKLKVLLQRVEAKDYRDVVALIRAGVSLSKGLAAARAMYGPIFQPSECLKALVYFEGGDLHTLSQDERNALIEAVSTVRSIPPVAIIARSLAT
jgi:hypothetical protein